MVRREFSTPQYLPLIVYVYFEVCFKNMPFTHGVHYGRVFYDNGRHEARFDGHEGASKARGARQRSGEACPSRVPVERFVGVGGSPRPVGLFLEPEHSLERWRGQGVHRGERRYIYPERKRRNGKCFFT